jgi:hypothetical protein
VSSDAQRLLDARILGGAVPATLEEKRAAAERSGSLHQVIGTMFEAEGINRPAPVAASEDSAAGAVSKKAARVAEYEKMPVAKRQKIIDELQESLPPLTTSTPEDGEVDLTWGYDPSHGEDAEDENASLAELVDGFYGNEAA